MKGGDRDDLQSQESIFAASMIVSLMGMLEVQWQT